MKAWTEDDPVWERLEGESQVCISADCSVYSLTGSVS